VKLNTLTIITAVILIGAGGFMAGRVSLSQAAGSSAASAGDTVRGNNRNSSSGGGPIADRESRRDRPDRDNGASGSRAERLAKLESIVSGEDPFTRNRAIMDLIDQLGPEDFATALTRFQELGFTKSRMGEYSLLLSAWASVDPVGALEYSAKSESGKFARYTVLTAWATNDPDAAIRWAEENHTGKDANPYLPGIIRGLAATDPARATTLLTSLPGSTERGEGLDFMLPHLFQQGADATRAWIASIDDESLKDGAMVRAARELAENDPASTVDWLLETPGEGTQRRIDDTFGVWATRDKEAAMAKFNELPAGEVRADALRGMVSSVAETDPAGALEMMNRFPEDLTDKSIEDYIKDASKSDPTLALAQVLRIQDEKDRDKVQGKTLGRWMESDPEAAQQWIDANPVSDAVYQRMGKRRKGVR
jgi:hypothetical protein